MKTQKEKPLTKRESAKWCRTEIDEKALAAGCRFMPERGKIVLDFFEKCLRLYEGEYAGQPFVPIDWQIETTMQMFGWVRWSDRFNRWVRRFKSATIWIPKKNGKSPTLAAWALYMFLADGEQGQKCYLFAKDGMQAREIAGRHVVEMIWSSPALMRECKINRNLFRVSHLPTRSTLQPMASNDSRSQKAKEGLNGSIFVDETHVVDRAAMNRVSRAGISRAEPFQIEVSTAGDDPTSYGKERFDYGEAVNLGQIEDLTHYHKAYAAPQNLRDADLIAYPLKYFQMANPALGRMIDPVEIMADFQSSQRSASEFALFKMYRLNIWQGSSSPWLNVNDWSDSVCDHDDLIRELAGRECYGGLDLAKTRDTTSLQLMFPPEHDGDRYKLLSFFWLPEATIERYKSQVQYQNWARDGFIKVTEGNVCDYNQVREDIIELAKTYDLRVLRYDPYNATQLALQLTDDGITCEEFPQTTSNLAEPTKDFERLLLAGQIAHDGNKCMAWQIGNAKVRTDTNGNLKIIKPAQDDYRKVDGPVAAVMALTGAMQPVGGSYYDQPGAVLEMG